MKLAEIAQRIAAHLKRFEADPVVNAPFGREGWKPYFHTSAGVAGAYIWVTYVSYQGSTNLRKNAALDYLAWLDAGNVGTHFTQQRAAT